MGSEEVPNFKHEAKSPVLDMICDTSCILELKSSCAETWLASLPIYLLEKGRRHCTIQ